MKLRHLEEALQCVKPFEDPDVQLEQYPTSAHIAARVLYTAEQCAGDVAGKTVVDLGCGTGMFAIGAHLMGSVHTVGVDIDPRALALAQANAAELEASVDFVLCDVAQLAFGGPIADTAFMNPPFGTRKKGIDMVFVQQGLRLARTAVYSLHKRSTREHILKKAASWGVRAEVVAELAFDIPQMYSFHRKRSKDVEVDLVRFAHGGRRVGK